MLRSAATRSFCAAVTVAFCAAMTRTYAVDPPVRHGCVKGAWSERQPGCDQDRLRGFVVAIHHAPLPSAPSAHAIALERKATATATITALNKNAMSEWVVTWRRSAVVRTLMSVVPKVAWMPRER